MFSVITMAMVTVLLSLFSRLGESVGSLVCGKSEEGMVEEQIPSSVTEGETCTCILPGTILVLYNPEASRLSCLLPLLLNTRLAIWAHAASKFALNRQISRSWEAVEGNMNSLHVASQNQLFSRKVSIQCEFLLL